MTKNPLTEQYLNDNETFWAWVSPDNNLYKVPKLNHKGFIMRQYKDKDFGWDYDRVFDRAIRENWVRVIYEYFPNEFRGELSINGYDRDRVKEVLKIVFKDLLRYGWKTVFVDYEDPRGSEHFSTKDSAGKFKLMKFINESKENTLKTRIREIIKEMAYPTSFNMEEFKQIRSFSERTRYCENRLRRISSGSGRIVYQIDDQKVLKLAKNQKGIAQNEVESEYYIQNYSIAARVFESDDNSTFVEMELAKKCSKSDFERITGFKIELIYPYLYNRFKLRYNEPKMRISIEDEEMLHENEWIQDLGELVGDYDMELGDLVRLSSYGIVKREYGDEVVLIDFGLSTGVYNDYYARK